MADRGALIKKVKVLLARAADAASSENEMLKAASMAAKLMDEHAIGESDLERAKPLRFHLTSFKFKFNWQRDIYFSISQEVGNFYGCFPWGSTSGKENEVNFYGDEPDVICAKWLVETIGKFVLTGWEDTLNQTRFRTQHERETYRFGYLSGAAQRINIRLREMRTARTNSYVGTTLPALVDKANAAKNALVAVGAEFGDAPTKARYVPNESIEAGEARGNAAPIRSGIGGANAPEALPSQ